MKLIIFVFLVTTAAAQTTPSNAGCGNTSYYGPSGVISSPNYPGDYGDSLNCNYNIFASSKSLMSFDFESFDTERCCDHVTISCSSDPSLSPQQFSGNSLPGTVWVSGCTQGLVNLRTDSSDGYSGFRLRYNVTVEVATVCGDVSLHGPSGVVSSPNYPDNYNDDLNCNYYIYGSNGSSFTITFKSFDVENAYDSLTVSCPTNSSFLPRSYSGYSLPDAISIPWCSQALVNFQTDSSTVSSGFSLNYYVSVGACGNTLYTGPSGTVTTSNFPNYYSYNQNCSTIIWAPERSTFHLYFESLTLYGCCTCDFLEIRCIDNSDYGPYKFCGSHASSSSLHVQQCSQVLLWFHSDLTNNNPGFKIQYTVYPDAEITTVAGIPGYTQTTYTPQVSTLEPACKYEYRYGPSGVITSPNYPGNYYNGLNCYYYIYATTGSSISFIFTDFQIEDSPDYLRIYCSSNSSFPDQHYSGFTLPPPLSVPWCSMAYLYFYTDSNTVFSGFSIDYYVSDGGCGNTVYNGSSGNVMSPNYPSNYSYYQNCSNIIWTPQRSHFQLNFLFFELQECGVCPGDWVEVSCLDNNPSDKHRFCGTSKYPVDIYQCSQVLVWFHTDGSNNYQGFNLEYYVYPDSEITTLAGTTNFPQTTQRPQVSTSEPGCDEFHCGTSGTITSPNYPGNYDDSLKCNYYIQASTGSSITFIFQHFDLQDEKDYITISCLTNSSFPEQRYSGHTLPQPFAIPWCSQGSVYLNTDTDTVYSGFRIDYFVSDGGCENTVYPGSSGTVTSPKYPSNYGYYQNCSNIILAPQRSQFQLIFRYLSIQSCQACLCDWVEISCLDNNPSYKYRTCGSSETSLNLYHCTQVLVWFHSDGSSISQGFDLDYNVYPDQGCGETSYYDQSGVISSPNYAGPYSDGLYCDYNIYTSSSSGSIAIIYRAFSTEECCDHVTVSCPTNSSYPSVAYSGSTLPQPIAIPWCSQGRVNFDTDSSVISTGFSLEYHISRGGCGNTLYPGPEGYVSSPNYPNNYGVSQDCANIIWTYKPTSFVVSFLHIDLEECCDFVEISCLDNAEYGKHRFTGDTIPPPQYIPECTKILVWFYSDDSNERSGFSLEYFLASESEDRKALNQERHNGGEKVPGDGKPTSGEKVLNKERHKAGEKVPGDGMLSSKEKVPRSGKPNAAGK